MGRKIRHTKLRKVEHPYDLESAGKKYTVKIDDNGKLHIFCNTTLIIKGYTAIVILDQEQYITNR
jgi:hypothetical protein